MPRSSNAKVTPAKATSAARVRGAAPRVRVAAPRGASPALPKGLRPPSVADLRAGAAAGRTDALGARNAEEAQDHAELCRWHFDYWASKAKLKVDDIDFTLGNRLYAIPIYAASGDVTPDSVVVWRKPAQVGATTMEQLLAGWFARYHQLKVGMYFPGKSELNELVKDRFDPMVASNPEFHGAIHGAKKVVDTVGLKRMCNVLGGESSLYFRNIGGKSATESIPLGVVIFDEVRLYPSMAPVEKVLKRLQASKLKISRFYSTSGAPECDIDELYQGGTREVWLSKCLCFSMDTQVVVRRRGGGATERKSFEELATCWGEYDALSWDTRRACWRYRPITAFHDNGEQEVVEAKFRNGATVTATPDHRLLTPDDLHRMGPRAGRGTEIDVLAARPTRLNTALCATALPDSADARAGSARTPREAFAADRETLWVLGAFVAEGSWKTPGGSIAQIAQKKPGPLRARVLAWAAANYVPAYEDSNGVVVSLGARADLLAMFRDCGDGCAQKRFPPALLAAPAEQLAEALDGYLYGDGHRFTKTVDARGAAANRKWSCTTLSRELWEQLAFIGLRLGTPLYRWDSPPKGAKKHAYHAQYNPRSRFAQQLGDRIGAVSLRSVRPAGRVRVADITVDGTHNYVLADSGIVAHNCSDGGVDLATTFPDCIGFDRDQKPYYRCPRCKARIVDPQNGGYVAQLPSAAYRSFTCSSMVSPEVSPARIWKNFTTTKDIEEFYRSDCGIPFVDKKNQPVTNAVLDACTPALCGADPVHWAYLRPDLKHLRRGCAIGVDQGGNYLYVVVLRRARDGLLDLVHLEIVEADNPDYHTGDIIDDASQFPRLYHLMREFSTQCGVLDHYPNYAPALQAANTFRGHLFLSTYFGSQVCTWRDQDEDDINKSEKLQTPWQVDLHPYKAMDFAFRQLIDRRIRLPHPDALVQKCKHPTRGRFLHQRIAQRFRRHLTKMIRFKRIKNPETGDYVMEWRGPREDHFAHAFTYAVIAAERVQPTSQVYL